jgi:Fe-S-cluster containining protein
VAGEVVMTHAERGEIERAVLPPIADALAWAPHADARFTRLLMPQGCPLLAKPDGVATCTVHAVRPMNCRKYGCFRMDVDRELVPRNEAETLINILRSRDFQRQAVQMERKAQRWGASHGWLE